MIKKTKIKVTRVDDLTTKKMDRIIESDYTINLTGVKSTKQKIKNKLKNWLFGSLTTLFLVFGLNVYAYNSISLEDELNEIIELDEHTEADIDRFIEIIDSSQLKEDVNYDIFPKEGHEQEIEEIMQLENVLHKKEEILDNTKFDIDKLAKAVAQAETGICTKGYGVTHFNCHGIKHGNTVPCPGTAKMAMCKFNNTEESFEAFKVIWSKWYGEMPTLEMAERWTGKDRAYTWLMNVNGYYYK